MSDYLLQQGTKSTPQSKPIPGSTQVPNSAGGFAWEVDDWTKLRRFLILGTEGGSYYASERELTTSNVDAVRRCVAANGARTIQEIVDVSVAGRAPKNEPALYALAVCIALGDRETRVAAGMALPKVARTGTHLYHFVAYAETMRGWGKVMRKAVEGWYETKGDRLPYDVIKYRQRDGWSHRDLLRLAHPTASGEHLRDVFDFVAHSTVAPDVTLLDAFVEAQASPSPERTAELVEKHALPREALRPDHLSSPVVWEALLTAGMPMTALVRNLANLTRYGLLVPGSDCFRIVVDQLGDAQAIKRSRIHPIAALAALLTYQAGRGARGQNTWSPVGQIVDALDGVFYSAFGNVEKTGKRYLLALDVSGSMSGGTVAGVMGLTPRVASSAMAMVTARVEDAYEVIAFTGGGYQAPGAVHYTASARAYGSGNGVSPLAITPRQRLDDICRHTDNLPFGGTDCSLPMAYAIQHRREFDAFIVYTDSETWAGPVHPAQAIREYRERFVPDARLVVVGMVSNGFTIADPTDPGMLDVVGFDTATPNLLGEFASGRL